ncbi:hypothetical protein CLLU_34180 [Clostridium luticellarii]|uniref:Phospholipase C/D domain-containing protein n=2 Tax=Clostridium luticellarii TaxID=1691940 RepID=A0A2T0B7P6_9CLOT|nr:hypothetical protein CLLU_34180 [Clostridium luticellarii]
MITSTHLLISHIIFNHCSKKFNIKLNKFNFSYGNIKPDFVKDRSNHCHCLDESIDIVCEYYNKLVNTRMSVKEYSVTLGMICHFICDYFCLYHTEGYKDKNLFQHFIYELRLHFIFIALLLFKGFKIIPDIYIPEKSIPAVIYYMRKKYDKENKSFTRDITYAISTATIAADIIANCENPEYFYRGTDPIPFSVK